MGGRGSLVVFAMVPVLIILGYLGAKDIQVGDAMPGSSLLWPWHRYNRDGFRIAFSMPIVSPLFVVMEGKEEDDLLSCWQKPRRMCADNLPNRLSPGLPVVVGLPTREIPTGFSSPRTIKYL
jgi:hypothetical protein